MIRKFFIVRDRRTLLILAAGAPFFLVAAYWFALVGFTNPATRLGRDIESHARATRRLRMPTTFVHRPINQLTRPVSDFHLNVSADGSIRISYGKHEAGRYTARLDDRIAVAGDFVFRDIGSGVEIELVPGGRTIDVASVKPLP
jgi:hypothetical protein